MAFKTFLLLTFHLFAFTLVSGDGSNVFRRWGKTENSSSVDAALCLYVVLKRAVYSGKQTRDVLGLKYKLGGKTRQKSKQYTPQEG